MSKLSPTRPKKPRLLTEYTSCFPKHHPVRPSKTRLFIQNIIWSLNISQDTKHQTIIDTLNIWCSSTSHQSKHSITIDSSNIKGPAFPLAELLPMSHSAKGGHNLRKCFLIRECIKVLKSENQLPEAYDFRWTGKDEASLPGERLKPC